MHGDVFVIATVKAQNKIKFIKNKTIKFEVVRKSFEFIDTNNIVPAKYFIKVNSNSNQRKEIKTLTSEDWKKLLNDTHSDWAANLILYDMYERNAFFFIIKNKRKWRMFQMERDIQYWSEHLK